MIGAWIAQNGSVCPGFERPEHEVPRSELTVDHIKPKSVDPGRRMSPDNLRVLCHSCNSRRGHTGSPDTGAPSLRPGQREAMIAMGAALREARERAGIDVIELASRLSLSKPRVRGVEEGAFVLEVDDYDDDVYDEWLRIVGLPEPEVFLREHGDAFDVPYLEWRRSRLENSLMEIVILARVVLTRGLANGRYTESVKSLRTRAQLWLEELARARDHEAIDAVWASTESAKIPLTDLRLLARTGRTYSEWLLPLCV